ncbi:uncharacterized protein LOC121243124 [Juglans microcarpa x Juglans regia]|uniref:uncharacterized protein LOC121243124 n=1 Tax=Juglans microcarpa x Juglans regia TaxID=2249226 RepID=UPI001B7E9B98|nr:uncharacterized protein LOC121243124 [Juglans microcarpa x Juglans regia]
MDSDMEHADNEYDEVEVDNEQKCAEIVDESKVGMTFSSAEKVVLPYEVWEKECRNYIDKAKQLFLKIGDARNRAMYESFGDVIIFDTTYLTNTYKMPFAPFVGVNHHGHSILFGCGLISNKDANTFE